MSMKAAFTAILFFPLSLFAQNVVTNPTGSQSIVQPAGTRFNVNDSGGVLYADQFTWSQSPSGSLSAGLNTLTLNPCPLGVNPTDTYGNLTPHWLYITKASTDTNPSEPVPIMGGTPCSGGSETIQVVTGYSHIAGYSIGSATGGAQEAERYSTGLNSTIVLPVHPGADSTTPTHLYAPLYISQSEMVLQGPGSNVECDFYANCLQLGNTYSNGWGNSNSWTGATVRNMRFQPGATSFTVSPSSPTSIVAGTGATVPIGSITGNGTTATFTGPTGLGIACPANFTNGSSVTIIGSSVFGYNGSHTISTVIGPPCSFMFSSTTTTPAVSVGWAVQPLTLTIPTCPTSFNARVQNQWLWLNGANSGYASTRFGTGEFVQVVGGTCTPGKINGTIQIVQGSPGLTSLGGHQSGYDLVGGINFPVEDNAQGSSFEGLSIYGSANGTFGGVLWIDNDQAAKVTNIEPGGYPFVMNADYQSAYLFAPGPFSINAGILYGSKLDLSGQASINCVNWYSGNDLSLEDSVCQGYENYGYKISKAGGGFGNVTLKHIHDETGLVSNPIDVALGTAGMIDQGYNLVRTGPMSFTNGWPQAATNTPGQAFTTWYLVYSNMNGSTRTESVPIPIAYGNVSDPSASNCVNGSTSCATTLKFFVPHSDANSPLSADILRVTAPNTTDSSVIAPNGTANYLVKNVVFNASNCNVKGVCTSVDNVAPAALGSYTVLTEDAGSVPFYPWIEFAPGGLVMSNAGNTYNGPFSGWPTYSGTWACINSPTPISIPLFTINETSVLGGVTSGRCLTTAKGYLQLSPQDPGCCSLYPALLLNNAPEKGGVQLATPQTGRINFGGPFPALSADTETIWDSNPSLTEQTGGIGTGFEFGRRTLAATDIGIGTEGDGSGNVVGLQIHGGANAINFYVNHVPDNASWLERLSATMKEVKVPIQFERPNGSTPTSQGNECASVVTDNSGGTVTAVPALRSVDSSNKAHDVACMVTADTTNPADVGSLVFPYINSFSTNSAASQLTPGVIEAAGAQSLRMVFSNNSGTTRQNSMLWRTCFGGGCGTDWNWKEDVAGVGNEDWTWIAGSGNAVLYVTGNCLVGCATTFKNVAGAKQFLLDDGTHTATTNPEFALVNGHIGHGTAGSNADNWGTLTCAANTVTYNFTTPLANNAYTLILTDHTTAGGAKASKLAGSFTITCTGTTDTVDYLVLGNPY
jgi:hypothetical protein